jgi:hypothetical protein
MSNRSNFYRETPRRMSGIFLDAMQRSKAARTALPGLIKNVLNQMVVTQRAAT